MQGGPWLHPGGYKGKAAGVCRARGPIRNGNGRPQRDGRQDMAGSKGSLGANPKEARQRYFLVHLLAHLSAPPFSRTWSLDMSDSTPDNIAQRRTLLSRRESSPDKSDGRQRNIVQLEWHTVFVSM